eukprot:2871783-Pyramimonas_sp.AAC.1
MEAKTSVAGRTTCETESADRQRGKEGGGIGCVGRRSHSKALQNTHRAFRSALEQRISGPGPARRGQRVTAPSRQRVPAGAEVDKR